MIWNAVAGDVCSPPTAALEEVPGRGSSNLEIERSPSLRRLTWDTAAWIAKTRREYSSGYITTYLRQILQSSWQNLFLREGQSAKAYRGLVLAMAIVISRARLP